MTDPSVDHFLGRVSVIEERVAAAVVRRREVDPLPDDPFRGLYLSDDQAVRLLHPVPPLAAPTPDADTKLAEVEAAADRAEQEGADLRLRRLARSLGLTELDIDLLLVALAPDVEPRLERLYGYLNDDVTRRRATICLALELQGASITDAEVRARIAPGCPLVDGSLVELEDTDRPLLGRSLRVPDRVTAHLLGDDRPDPVLSPLLLDPARYKHGRPDAGLTGALRAGSALAYLRSQSAGGGIEAAVATSVAAGMAPLVLDLNELGSEADPIAQIAYREGLLREAALVAGPVDALAAQPGAIANFATLGCPTLLTGTRPWEPSWSARVPAVVDVPELSIEERAAMWRAELNGDCSGLKLIDSVAHFRLPGNDVIRAVQSARLHAQLSGSDVTGEALLTGARRQNSVGLERLARRIEARATWDDLVLPRAVLDQLHDLCVRVRHRHRVLGEWRMRASAGRGIGVSALFAGESGTGKTLSAEVIAGDLGLDLYAVNLATVVDKYIGETEKNLERIFAEATGVNGVLLFDEADALFGKRSEVRDAQDRYANVEVAYLLQRMESFDGIAILTTNVRANLDESFTRRLDAVVDFPMPDEQHRRVLWDHCLGSAVPRADDIDFGFCAGAFELSGGSISSAAAAAAYRAADRGEAVSMSDLITATEAEYRKLGRLPLQREFETDSELI